MERTFKEENMLGEIDMTVVGRWLLSRDSCEYKCDCNGAIEMMV